MNNQQINNNGGSSLYEDYQQIEIKEQKSKDIQNNLAK